MVTATDTPDAFALSNGLWNEFYRAYEVINEPVRIALLGDATARGPLPNQWKPGFLRLIAWMHSITQLLSPSDFQAVFAAARAMLEVTVDAVLLQHQNDDDAQMCFPRSEVLCCGPAVPWPWDTQS